MESKKVAMPPATPNASTSSGLFKSLLKGSTFLTLEHTGHMALTVLLCLFMAAGVFSALSMWTGSVGIASVIGGLYQSYFGSSLKALEAMLALMLVVILAIAPLINLALDRRTRASWQKRSGYVGRLGYKLPLYIAMGLAAFGVIVSVGHMLYAVVASLALIGVQNAPISMLYLSVFLPYALVAVIFGFASWYLFSLARGRDNGRRYSMGVAIVGAVVALALLITSVIVLHSPNESTLPITNSNGNWLNGNENNYYDDLLNRLYQ